MLVVVIVNWFGIIDVFDLFVGENVKIYVVVWMGLFFNCMELGDEFLLFIMVSKENNLLILMFYGDVDFIVFYVYVMYFYEKFDVVGVMNQFYIVEGGGYGDFMVEEYKEVFCVICEFLYEVFSVDQVFDVVCLVGVFFV